MKIDPNASAIPVCDSRFREWSGGLTIRTEIASRNLAGLLANANLVAGTSPHEVIREAFRYADLFIDKLNEETPP